MDLGAERAQRPGLDQVGPGSKRRLGSVVPTAYDGAKTGVWEMTLGGIVQMYISQRTYTDGVHDLLGVVRPGIRPCLGLPTMSIAPADGNC